MRDIATGDILEIVMGNIPNKNGGIAEDDCLPLDTNQQENQTR
jgi:hypothetical protein